MARRQTAGVLCLDKPKGVSSRDVVNIVAGLARHNRVGHAGTLDPLATGVLVLCLGWATRLVPLLHLQPKRYRAVFRLGATSDTDDVTGTVIESPGSRVPELREIEDLLPRYTGSILQVPPTFSAIHTDGERAYAKARRGEATELAPRPVEVHALRLAAYDYPVLELDVECGSGTYIRAIGRDLGR
ncbi:MAG: tRNA pseudouridine(55) synthase TruB, partial [Planctomycetaceae bacterium]